MFNQHIIEGFFHRSEELGQVSPLATKMAHDKRSSDLKITFPIAAIYGALASPSGKQLEGAVGAELGSSLGSMTGGALGSFAGEQIGRLVGKTDAGRAMGATAGNIYGAVHGAESGRSMLVDLKSKRSDAK